MGHTKKRRRVRYDRIIGVAAVFIVLIILLVAGIRSCGKDNGKDKDSSIIPTISNDEKNKNTTDSTKSGGNTGTTEKNSDSSSTSPSEASDMSFSSVSAMPNEVFKGDLLLVNKDHAYSFPATDEDNSDVVPVFEIMSDSYNVADYEVRLSSKAVAALNAMMDEYVSAVGNSDIMLINGYRTREYQEGLNDQNVPAGCSDYHTGLSFDLGIFPPGENSYYYLPEGDYAWIDENCANYGFIVRYPDKKKDKTGLDPKTYQFRYVGVPHALYMRENNLCLEEYLELLKGYTSDGEHIKISDGEKKYEIYYAPADPAANTDIPVPDGKTYEISGNNVDGFIITAEV